MTVDELVQDTMRDERSQANRRSLNVCETKRGTGKEDQAQRRRSSDDGTNYSCSRTPVVSHLLLALTRTVSDEKLQFNQLSEGMCPSHVIAQQTKYFSFRGPVI